MQRLLPILAILVVLCRTVPVAGQQESDATLTLSQYVAALDDSRHVAEQLKRDPQASAKLLQSLPSVSWRVRSGDREFEIPTAVLRHDLEAWQKKNDEGLRERILAQLDALRAGAQAYESPAADVQARRMLLGSILARREFNDVHGPTWIDRLKQRLTELLFRLLGRVFASSTIPVISDIVVYGFMAFALLGVAYWLYRSIRESSKLESIMPVPVPVSAKEWPIWLQEARAAATGGDWRAAIHLAYWSGISFLEAQGAWRPDSARTPREYLRLLPSGSHQHPALRALTTRLEFVWYGLGQADADVFQQTLVDLEKLGCPCN
jgi:hypothetical protein